MGDPLFKITFPNGNVIMDSMPFGEIKLYPLNVGHEATIEATPSKHFDLGEGKDKSIKKKVKGGVVGIIIDTRGRPLALPEDKTLRVNALQKWAKAVNLYA